MTTENPSQTGYVDEPANVVTPRTPAWTGVLLIAGAAALWSLNGALIKLMDREHASGVAIAFYRSLIAGLFLLPLARGRFSTLRSSARTRIPLRPAALWCIVFFTLMTLCFVVANVMTEAANAIFLQYTSTFWVFGLSPWLLHERPRRSDLWLLVLAMVGIGIIFAGSSAGGGWGLVVALGSGLFYALLTLMIRMLRGSDPAALTVVNNLGAALLLLTPMLWLGGFALTPRAWVLITIMGVVQFGLPYYLYTLALARLPAFRAALITLLEPVLVPVWTYIAVGETVPTQTLVGGGVIFLALVLLLNSSRRSRPSSRRNPSDSVEIRSPESRNNKLCDDA